MANRSNLPNGNGSNDSHAGQSSDDQEINERIIYRPDHSEDTMPTQWWLILIFLCLGIGQCWYILIFALLVIITDRLLIGEHPPDTLLGNSQPWHRTSPLNYHAILNRDAEAEGRTAQPMLESIQSPSMVEIPDNAPLEIPNTHRHDDMAIPANLNNAQHMQVIINNGDVHLNEAATLYNNNGHNMIVPEIQNEANAQTTTDRDNVPQPVVDDPTYNINPLGSTETRDDINSSDSSDNEDPILSSGSGFDGDNENESSDDNEQLDRTSPTIRSLSTASQNDTRSNQTNSINGQPVASVPTANEALDTEENVSPPTEGACQVVTPLISRRTTVIPKPTSRVRADNESGGESMT